MKNKKLPNNHPDDRPWCPRCRATERHADGKHVQIRGYKVSDEEGHWSQCLVCLSNGFRSWFNDQTKAYDMSN